MTAQTIQRRLTKGPAGAMEGDRALGSQIESTEVTGVAGVKAIWKGNGTGDSPVYIKFLHST